jgi:glycosyltransferase involved in cell wall biosynthesis
LLLLPSPSRHRPPSLRVALVAPPWIAVPPPGYGGIETVVAQLARGLVDRGHDVTLLAAPGSHSTAHVVELLETTHGDEIERSIHEADHAARAIELIEHEARGGRPFDIVHDHSGYTLLTRADRVAPPVVHTVHGPFDDSRWSFYRRHGAKAWICGLSEFQLAQGPPELRRLGVIPNPIHVAAWPFAADKKEHLLWVGRMSPDKGPHRAIEVARRAGRPLVLAGPVQPGQEAFFAAEVEPFIDGDAVRYVEEVGGADKQRLFAEAAAFLMPIRWAEPFGMVMIEAMVCGTPVVAFGEGSAPEVVIDGVNGFLVEDEAAMVTAVGRLDELDPSRCRATVAERYDVGVVARAYELAYRRVLAVDRPAGAVTAGSVV